MSSSERFEELPREVQGAKWDVVLISETGRPGKEVWDTEQGRVVIESGKFSNKHGVAIIVSRKWKNKITWVECASERVVAASESVNKQPITLVSAYLPHNGYPDHQVERAYETIRRVIDKDENMKNRRWLQRWAWFRDWYRVIKCLATTHSTRRTTEMNGWRSGFSRRILSH